MGDSPGPPGCYRPLVSAASVVPSIVSGVLGLAGVVFGAIMAVSAQRSRNAADREALKRDIYARFIGGLQQATLAGIRPGSPAAQEPADSGQYERFAELMVLFAQVEMVAPRDVRQMAAFASMTVTKHRGQTSPEARNAVTAAILQVTDMMRADLHRHRTARPWAGVLGPPDPDQHIIPVPRNSERASRGQSAAASVQTKTGALQDAAESTGTDKAPRPQGALTARPVGTWHAR
jgi:hypothetical protein